MLYKLPEELKLELINNKITNVNSILEYLNNENNLEMLQEYYNFLINSIDINIYESLPIITNAIKNRIDTLENNINLKKELEKAQELNQSLKKFSIIEDPKEQNDTKKDLFYLKYIDENNEVHILEIDNNVKLLNLIATIAPTMDAKSFYNYLKQRHFNELLKHSLGVDKIDLLTYENNYLIPDKSTFLIEKELLEAYMKLNQPNVIAYLSIDSYKERLYYIGSTIIKFYDEDGKRQMKIVSKEENKKVNKNEQENEINESNITSTAYTDEEINKIPREEIEDIQVSTKEATPLLEKYVTTQTLTKDEKIKIYAYLIDLLDTLEMDFSLSKTEEDLLGAAIDHIRNIQANNIEIEILNRYNNYTKKQELEESKEQDPHKYILKNNNPLKVNDNGVSLSIIIITVTILLGSLLAAILIVK